VSYLSDLNWLKSLDQFDDDQQKILLALSHEKYRWRTKERLAKVSGLSETATERLLSQLIDRGLVRASISKKKQVIFGLRQRVG
jgi:predicted HTH transcriptional regulator